MDLWAPCPDWRQLAPGTEAACLTCEFYPCLLFERRTSGDETEQQPATGDAG